LKLLGSFGRQELTKIGSSGFQSFRAIARETKHPIASVTSQSSYFSGLVIVFDSQPSNLSFYSAAFWLTANCTFAILLDEQFFVFFYPYAVPLSVVSSPGSFWMSSFPIPEVSWIVLLELSDRKLSLFWILMTVFFEGRRNTWNAATVQIFCTI